LARTCLPIEDDGNAAQFGWLPADRPARLRLAADTYGNTSVARSGSTADGAGGPITACALLVR
jgi:hypothetical protein